MTKARNRGAKIPPPPDTLEVALSLAAVGWPVFPVSIYQDDSGKRHKVPAVKWKAEATTDAATIRAWWEGEHRGRWIGVYAGAADIVVLDIDWPSKKRQGGLDSLAAVGLEPPPTLNYDTPSGGTHAVYRAPLDAELTIAQDLVVDGVKLEGVDVRSGAGLMVYYGPRLDAPPYLADAPPWLLVPRGERNRAQSDAAPDANVDTYMSRLTPGKASKKIRHDTEAIEFPEGAAHDVMLETVTALVGLGTRGHPVADLMAATRDRYVGSHPDRGRDWDNAVAGSVRRLGLPPVTLELTDAERAEIARRNDPLVIAADDAERKAAYRIEKHRAAMTPAAEAPERPMPGDRVLEDASLADELAQIFRGQWAYARGFGLMRWRGTRWESAEEHSLIEAVRRELVTIEIDEHTVAAMAGSAKRVDKARTLLARARASAVARLIVGILAEDSPEFDAHPDMLNTPSGVVNLKSSELAPHDPYLYFTKVTGAPYDPNADMTQWHRALEVIPADTAAYLQYRLGQAATGYTPDDDVLCIFEGAGENGKTSFTIGVTTALGDYVATLPERLLVGDPGDHPTTLMTLLGARVGVIEELPEGRALNVKRLKDTVGTPKITARRMRQDDMTFRATHALFLNTNYLPIVAETDHGTWRRLVLIRFPIRFVKRKKEIKSERDRLGDPSIKRYFEHNADPGLLRWLVEGARLWYANGMRMPQPPKTVRADTEAWRMDADPILAYATERLERSETHAITAADLAEDFNTWLERRGHRRWTQQTINSRFQGHVSLDGVDRKPVKFSSIMQASRPGTIMSIKPIPAVTTSWRGIRFVDEPSRIPSAAEREAAELADLNRRLRD